MKDAGSLLIFEGGGGVPSHRDGDTALDQSFASTLLRIQSAVAAALCRRTPNECYARFSLCLTLIRELNSINPGRM